MFPLTLYRLPVFFISSPVSLFLRGLQVLVFPAGTDTGVARLECLVTGASMEFHRTKKQTHVRGSLSVFLEALPSSTLENWVLEHCELNG